MANILYGVNGEGSGHWTRSKEVIDHLLESGHKVNVVSSGRASANLKNFFEVEDVFGFGFRFTRDKVDEFATFINNFDAFPKGARSVKKAADLIKEKDIDLVITDFEPISYLASKFRRVPVISIDNQHFITNTDALLPGGHRVKMDFMKTVVDIMIPNADAYIALSFFEANPKDDKTIVASPIVRREVFNIKPSEGDYILIYLTHGFDKIAEILRPIRYKFIFYGANEDRQEGNICFKKFSQENFLSDLAGSRGVLATAGFSLISESLYWGKPYFAWPVRNQFEQIFNAYHIDRLGYGKYRTQMDSDAIEAFLFNLDHYKTNLSRYSRRNNSILFEKLNELIRKLT